VPHDLAAGSEGDAEYPLDRATLALSAYTDKLRRQAAQGFDSPGVHREWHGDSMPKAGDVSSLGHAWAKDGDMAKPGAWFFSWTPA